MKQVCFKESEIPYETLEQFNLTREMLEDLPLSVLQDIGHGRPSPVLGIQVTDEEGNTTKSYTRITLVRLDNDKVDVVFCPVLTESPLGNFDATQQEELLAGKAIIADVENQEGKRSKAFVQIDPETKQVMYTQTPVIGRNLQVLAQEMKLSNAEIKVMQQGEPLTFVMEDEPVTIGIDLNTATGLRFCSGDTQKWKEENKREWDKYTFGCYGCWIMSDEGYLDYVSEEDYTEELWNEQKKQGQRNAAGLHK